MQHVDIRIVVAYLPVHCVFEPAAPVIEAPIAVLDVAIGEGFPGWRLLEVNDHEICILEVVLEVEALEVAVVPVYVRDLGELSLLGAPSCMLRVQRARQANKQDQAKHSLHHHQLLIFYR